VARLIRRLPRNRSATVARLRDLVSSGMVRGFIGSGSSAILEGVEGTG
jgi:hypothetical protein